MKAKRLEVWAALRSASSSMMERRELVAAGVTFSIAMVVYLFTMMPGPAFMDTGEYQTVTYVLGCAHPTGYPLYTMVGKLFGTLVPLGNWAFRMNLMSALSTAISAAMLALLAMRYGVSAVPAVAASLGFAFTLNTWRASGHADPYTLTLLIGASLWWMALKWRDTGERAWLWKTALLSGIGLGSAGVLSMELPAIILFTILVQPRKFVAPVTMIVAATLGVVGLFGIYLYLPIRSAMNPPLNYGNTSTLQGFLSVVNDAQVGGIANHLNWETFRRFFLLLPTVPSWYGEWLTPMGRDTVIVFALIGIVALIARDWRLAVCVLPGFLIPIFPTLTMPINDTTHYLLIPNWLLFFTAAMGAQALLLNPIGRINNVSIRRPLSFVISAILLALPCYVAKANWSSADSHGYHDAEILAKGVFDTVKPHAVVFCWWGPSNGLWYAHYVEGLRPDVDVYDDSSTLDRGWGGVVPAIGHFYPQRPCYSLPLGDQADAIQKKYKLKLIKDLQVFGQSLYEVVGPSDSPLSKAP